jgi:Ca2+-binding EF-hand superfamily protein
LVDSQKISEPFVGSGWAAASDGLKVEEKKNIMRTSILTSLVSGFIVLALAGCSGAGSEPVDQSAQAETAALNTPPASSAAAPAPANSATAEHHGHHAPDPAAFIKRFDKNGDGVLQISELPEHMQKWLAKADTNGDGVLSLDELKAGEEKMRANFMAKADTNHDGTVSPEERKAAFEKFAEARFAKLDKNGDGALTEAEVGEKRWARLSVADADKNGSVTEAELQQAVASGVLKFPHRGHHGHHDADGAAPPAADPSAPGSSTGS